MDAKAARLIALSHAIQEEYFDPDTVNMSDVARALGVSRGTIMRDLDVVNEMMESAKQMQATLRSTPTTTSRRND